ncbi:hypothetical protein WMY93_032195 [Mugilogobius chulae]|uniref:RING-type domain-containing protein n=1 Tax=Mugilogobius chulae TaxID=88201 RepID=A0AAW0MD51_9GOBI
MASRLEEDLTCSICHDLFKDPVLLSCSHSFCKVCLENWWKNKPIKTCPVCKRRSSKDYPPLNLVLKNLVETFIEQKTRPLQSLCAAFIQRNSGSSVWTISSRSVWSVETPGLTKITGLVPSRGGFRPERAAADVHQTSAGQTKGTGSTFTSNICKYSNVLFVLHRRRAASF